MKETRVEVFFWFLDCSLNNYSFYRLLYCMLQYVIFLHIDRFLLLCINNIEKVFFYILVLAYTQLKYI